MIGGLINLIVYMLIVGVLLALVYWLVDVIPIPEPLNRIIKIIIVVLAVLVLVILLLQLIGTGAGLPKIVPG